MKRVGYVMEEIVDRRNLEDAFDYKVRGRVARSRKGRWLTAHREEVLDTIGRELLEGTWTPGHYSERMITERGKTRRIQSVTLEKAIALNAVMKVVERHLDPSFITATAASIKGRGMLYLFEQLQRDRRRDPEGTRIVRVDDIRKFYENIPQGLAMVCLRRKFKDARLLTVLERCVKLMPQGLSIGLRPSQAIANLVLSTQDEGHAFHPPLLPLLRRYTHPDGYLRREYPADTTAAPLPHGGRTGDEAVRSVLRH